MGGMNLTEHAVRAIQQGLWIFPVEPWDKTPCRLYPYESKKTHPWTIKWSEVATNDMATAVAMWQWCQHANVGVAAKQSGILIVDCDMAKTENQLAGTDYEYMHQAAPYIDGETVFNEVCLKYGGNWQEVTDTYTVTTGSGGAHYYYRWPEGIQASQGSIVKGILDIRCNGGNKGGYVLAAGSETSKGVYSVGRDRSIRPAPGWLVELCREIPRPARPARPKYAQPRNANFGGLVDAVRQAGEGNRNNMLLYAVRCMVSDGAKEEEAEELLTPAAQAAGLSDTEIRDTIRSGWRLQAQKEGV